MPARWRRRSAFPIGADDDAGAVFERAAEVAVAPARRRARGPGPSFMPQAADGVTLRRQDRAGRPDARSRAARRRARAPGASAVAAHRGARRAPRAPGHGLAGARGGGRARSSRVEVQPDGGKRMDAAALAPRPALSGRRSRRRARRHSTSCGGSSRTRPTPTAPCATAAAGLDDRDRALARQLAYGTVQRARTLDHAIETIGRRPVRRLDAPVRAALRLGAYQLAFLDGVPRYAAVNESVELVRRARLERAVPFTNAVLRRLADGGSALVEALPELDPEEAALAHSYPDWIAETWWRDLGAEGALALMRAQNEPRRRPLSGSSAARSTASRTPMIPGAWHVERVDEAALAEGRIWPQSAGSQLAGLVVGSHARRARARPLRRARRQGDDARRRGRRRSSVNEARARELEENVTPARRRRTCTSSARTAARLPAELTGFDRALVDAPCSGLGVLAARPDLRWRSQPLPGAPARAPSRRRRAGEARRHGHLLRLHGQRATRARLSSMRRARVDESLAAAWPQFRHPARPEFLQTLPHVHGTSGFFIARLRVREPSRRRIAPWAGATGSGTARGRAVALRRRLHAARRADRGAARRGLPHLPLRRRRRPLRPAGDDRPDRPPVDRADDPRGGRRHRLPPDGRRPGPPLRGDRRIRRRLASRSTSRPQTTRRGSPRRPARTASRSASRSTPAPSPTQAAAFAAAAGAEMVLCMSIEPGYSGQAVHARGAAADRASSRAPSTCRSRSTAASASRTSRRLRDAGATCSSPGTRSSPTRTRRRVPAGSRRRCMSLERALALAEAARGVAYPESRPSAPSSSRAADRRRGRDGALRRPARRGRCARGGRRPRRGATLYVTMEPCAHHGRTPPCVDAILAAGVARVVAGQPRPESGGCRRARAARAQAGVEAELDDRFEARRQNEAWRTWSRSAGRSSPTRSPTTLDGRVTVPGTRWVTGEESRRLVHELRAAVGCGRGRDGDRAGRRPAPRCARCPGRAPAATARLRPRAAAARTPSSSSAPGALAESSRLSPPKASSRSCSRAARRSRRRSSKQDLVDKLLVFVAPTLSGAGPRLPRRALLAEAAAPPLALAPLGERRPARGVPARAVDGGRR